MRTHLIPIIKPDLSFDAVAKDLRLIIESGRLTLGPYVADFEASVANYVGVRHAFAVTSATTALHLALVANGIGLGDEVLVSDFTFPATGNVIVQAGAIPVLVDCRPDAFDIDVEAAEALVSPRTRAILVVDPFGQPCDLAAIHTFAKKHGLAVIEDAACAIGGALQGRKCGAWPGTACFSFHPRKVVTTGEGGMITTDDEALAKRIKLLRNHGGEPGEPDDVGMRFIANGYNYRMSEIQACLGLEQMRRLDAIIDDRRRIAIHYIDLLEGLDGVSVPLAASPEECTFQSFVLLLDDKIDRNRTVHSMRQDGIETTLGTYAMHAQPAFARYGYKPGALPQSWRAQRQSLTLPLLPHMDETQIAQVVVSLKRSILAGRC